MRRSFVDHIGLCIAGAIVVSIGVSLSACSNSPSLAGQALEEDPCVSYCIARRRCELALVNDDCVRECLGIQKLTNACTSTLKRVTACASGTSICEGGLATDCVEARSDYQRCVDEARSTK